MASKERVSSWELSDYLDHDFFWGVNRSVGYGCPNHYDDVLLVQFLLNAIMKRENSHLTPLVLDGKFGSKTYNRIRSFQRWFNMNIAHNLAYDGMISSADGSDKDWNSVPGYYTIWALNNSYRVRFGDQFYQDIRRDPEIPNDLKHLMMVSV